MFFDNTACLRCGAELAYDPDRELLIAIESSGRDGVVAVDGLPQRYRRCAYREVAQCNWLVGEDDPVATCASCRLTSVRPADDDPTGLEAYADAEFAKRRLVRQLVGLGLPVLPRTDAHPDGLAFELLSSRGRTVTTGHRGGTITLDLSESDDAHREFVRLQLGEPYRTVLGHLRHEIGHYYWPMSIVDGGYLDEFRTLFGDERASYDHALETHYDADASAAEGDWVDQHVSRYATMHPWEDWAETFAHYLHIQAGIETADAFGLTVGDPSASAGAEAWSAPAEVEISPTIDRWLGLSFALNAMSRSIGQNDLYPFVLSSAVVAKLDLVHRSIASVAGRLSNPTGPSSAPGMSA